MCIISIYMDAFMHSFKEDQISCRIDKLPVLPSTPLCKHGYRMAHTFNFAFLEMMNSMELIEMDDNIRPWSRL